MPRVEMTDEEWRQHLSPDQYAVLRQAATERPGTGELLHEKRAGLFRCAGCGNKLFLSDAKYESGCGWPSFWKPVSDDAVIELEDRSHGMVRTEIQCASCGSHLGHVFDDGPPPTGLRFCMNSLAMSFDAESEPAP
ncbi:MAG TPA: peptide-methionine (R)-S-oxide reductase MsrB [Acidimicrobiales bacterium]|nr:peptide-methionine (R)-S-oxide reductase MsrB [Acidimicrobiales bacterium]